MGWWSGIRDSVLKGALDVGGFGGDFLTRATPAIKIQVSPIQVNVQAEVRLEFRDLVVAAEAIRDGLRSFDPFAGIVKELKQSTEETTRLRHFVAEIQELSTGNQVEQEPDVFVEFVLQPKKFKSGEKSIDVATQAMATIQVTANRDKGTQFCEMTNFVRAGSYAFVPAPRMELALHVKELWAASTSPLKISLRVLAPKADFSDPTQDVDTTQAFDSKAQFENSLVNVRVMYRTRNWTHTLYEAAVDCSMHVLVSSDSVAVMDLGEVQLERKPANLVGSSVRVGSPIDIAATRLGVYASALRGPGSAPSGGTGALDALAASFQARNKALSDLDSAILDLCLDEHGKIDRRAAIFVKISGAANAQKGVRLKSIVIRKAGNVVASVAAGGFVARNQTATWRLPIGARPFSVDPTAGDFVVEIVTEPEQADDRAVATLAYGLEPNLTVLHSKVLGPTLAIRKKQAADPGYSASFALELSGVGD
jgi:hypothetical protein